MISPFRNRLSAGFACALIAGLLLSTIPSFIRAEGSAQRQGKIVASLDFDPGRDGFGFSNYSKREHDSSHDMGAADLIRMFGAAAVCKNSNATEANCVIKASARGWMDENLEAMGGGHCEGMAVACLRFMKHMTFKGRTEPRDYQTGVANTFGLKLDPKMANNIAYYWTTQSFDEILTMQDASRKSGPLAIVNTLIKSMNEGNETYTFGFCKRKSNACTDGHAITPFAVEDDGTQYKVHVYDNNDSGETKFLTVQKGGKHKWNYIAAINPNEPPDIYTGDDTTRSLEIIPTSKREGRCFSAPFDESVTHATGCGIESGKPAPPKPADPTKPAPTPAKPGPTPAKPAPTPAPGPAPKPPVRVKYADFFLTGDGDMVIMDSKNRRLGYDPDADDYFNEIPGGKVAELVGGKGFDMPHYRIPYDAKAEPYVVVFSGRNLDEESVMDFVFTGPGFSVGFDGIMLDPGEFLVAAITPDGERLSMEMSKDGEMPDVYYSVDTPKKSYMAEVKGSSGQTDVSGTLQRIMVPLARLNPKSEKAPPQMTIDFVDANKLQISDNIEGDSNYDVDIEQFDAAGKTDKIQLNDVGKGDGGADAYEIEIGKWDGGKKIAVKHDDEGNGFDDDEEVLDDDEQNDIPDDDDGLMNYLFQALGW